jgi:hypothetical protein
MSTSAERRYKRSQQRLYAKIEKEFLQRIKGKSTDEVAVILDQIRIKYNLDRFNKPEEEQIEFIQPIDVDTEYTD